MKLDLPSMLLASSEQQINSSTHFSCSKSRNGNQIQNNIECVSAQQLVVTLHASLESIETVSQKRKGGAK